MRILEGIPLRFQILTVDPLIREARIQKVFLTETRETWLELRSPHQSGFLVLSTHPDICLFYYTHHKPHSNKIKVTAWEQILNKYLVGAKIIGLEQMVWDRVLRLTVQNQRLWNEQNLFHLYAELTGRNANCILTTPFSPPQILGCQKLVSSEHNRYRTITVGDVYQLPPPKPAAIDPMEFIQEQVELPLPEATDNLDEWLLHHLDGVGPFLARELAESWWDQPNGIHEPPQNILRKKIHDLCRPLFVQGNLYSVYHSRQDQRPVGIFWLESRHYACLPHRDFSDLNQAVEYLVRTFWALHADQDQKRKKKIFIEKELIYLEEERNKVEVGIVPEHQLSQLLTKGNLLKLYPQLEIKEQKSNGVMVSNLLSMNDEDIFIQIDPRLSINQNMQLYFRDYRKSQTRNHLLLKKKIELEFRRNRLENELKNIDQVFTLDDQKNPSPEPGLYEPGIMKFLTPSGNTILVGKNDRANHQLVTRFSSRDDHWLHVRDFPGSHVLFRVTQDPDTLNPDLFRAAKIAAYYSSARNENSVDVVCSSIKNIKTIPRAGLGKMTYQNEKNLSVVPGIPNDIRRI